MNLTRRECLAGIVTSLCNATTVSVSEQWRQIAAQSDGPVGAAALHLGSGKRVGLHGDDPFPLASVCKLPIAIAVLAMVDGGRLSLKDEIDIPLEDVVPGVSIVAERYLSTTGPKQRRFPLDELLELMVAKSDNSAVQTLFRIAGGAPGMAARFRQWRIDGIRVDRSERQCTLEAAGVRHIPPISKWTPGMVEELTASITPRQRLVALRRFLADPRDTATPYGTVDLLKRAFRGELLSASLTARLASILEATTTGSARIKGLLPGGTLVAHKTGTTSTILNFNGATNDVGVITLPKGGGQLAIAIYLKASSRDQASREAIIARIAKAAFDSWSNMP